MSYMIRTYPLLFPTAAVAAVLSVFFVTAVFI